jgi:hypothetical protein
MTLAHGRTGERRRMVTQRLRERRRQLGLTQKQVVSRLAKLGVLTTNKALSSLEHGAGLDVAKLPELAMALECTVTYLLGLTADPCRWEPDEPGAEHDVSTTPSERGVPADRRLAVPRGPVGPMARPPERGMAPTRGLPPERSVVPGRGVRPGPGVPVERQVPVERGLPVERGVPVARGIPVTRGMPADRGVPSSRGVSPAHGGVATPHGGPRGGPHGGLTEREGRADPRTSAERGTPTDGGPARPPGDTGVGRHPTIPPQR